MAGSAIPTNAQDFALLACPACQDDLRFDANQAVCITCNRSYPVLDGIPVLIPGRAEQK